MNFILDIDGTLWNTTEVVAEAWNDATEDVGLGETLGRFITAGMLQREFGKPMDEIISDLYPGQSAGKWDQILRTVKIREKEALRKCSDALSYPGVTDTVKKLPSMGHRLFIVSNCQEGYIELVMSKLGIEDCIDDFESFGNTGFSKAENITLLMRRNRFANGDTYYVGDTMGDYSSASEAGIPFIFAAYGFGQMPEDYKGLSINRFSDLLSLF